MKKPVIAIAAALFCVPAAAQYSLGEDPGFYAGGTLGMNGDQEAAWRLLLGYQTSRNFALELG